jgi:hypothetical protein
MSDRRVKRCKGLRKKRPVADGGPAVAAAAAAERDNIQHWILEKAIVDLCLASGIVPLTDRLIDVLANSGPVSIIFEMKSCSPLDVPRQLRGAVWRLLEFRYLYRIFLEPEVRLCVVIEHRPSGRCQWLLGFLESLGIGIIWGCGDGSSLQCNDFTKALLGDVLPLIRTWPDRATVELDG